MIEFTTPAITTIISILDLIVWLNNMNLPKKPANTGIPAIDNKEAVSTAAINGLVLPDPLKVQGYLRCLCCESHK